MSLKRPLLAICLATFVAVGGASVAFSADFGAAPEPVLPPSQ